MERKHILAHNRIDFYLPVELTEKLKDAAVERASCVSHIVARACWAWVRRSEALRGEPYPRRQREPKLGRPYK